MRWIKGLAGVWASLLGPFWVGVLSSLLSVAGIAAGIWVLVGTGDLSGVSVSVCRDLAQVSIGLVLAFVVATAAVQVRTGEALEDHLKWLGFVSGVGLAGIASIGAGVVLAAYREAGHAGAPAAFGLSWMIASLTIIGGAIALLPYASFQWRRPVDDD